jgi:hypothetical protein
MSCSRSTLHPAHESTQVREADKFRTRILGWTKKSSEDISRRTARRAGDVARPGATRGTSLLGKGGAMSGRSRVNLARFIKVRRVIQTVASLFGAMILGCATSSATRHGDSGTVVSDNTSVESGKLLLAAHAFSDVYYSPSFAATPALDVPDHWGNCKVVISTPTHFRVFNQSDSQMMVEWKANGLKAPPPQVPALAAAPIQAPIRPVVAQSPSLPPIQAPVPAAAAPPAASPAPGLPAEPVPVTSSR